METQSFKVIFRKYCLQETAGDILLPPLWGRGGGNVGCSIFLFTSPAGGAIRSFFVVNCKHAGK